MMSLVAYGSDSSDEENEEMEVDPSPPASSSKDIKSINSGQVAKSDAPIAVSADSSSSIGFLKIPKPSESDSQKEPFEEEGPLLPKKIDYGDELEKPPGNNFKASSFANLRAQKVGGIMKISIPSLKDFDKELDSDTKKPKVLQPSTKKSGLFAILPQPKQANYSFVKASQPPDDEIAQPSSISDPASVTESVPAPSSSKPKSSFVPHIVQQTLLGKRPTPSKLDEIRAKYIRQEANVQIVSRKEKPAKEDSDDDDGPIDFFSFANSDDSVPVDPSLKLPDYQPPASPTPEIEPEEDEAAGSSYPSNADTVMNLIPQSRRSKKEEINFIDVSANDLRSDPQEWVKNITAEDPVPRRSRDAPGGMTKRKHQITYLAFEAKEREQTLKAQWAQNRHNKRMTQSKYGF